MRLNGVINCRGPDRLQRLEQLSGRDAPRGLIRYDEVDPGCTREKKVARMRSKPDERPFLLYYLRYFVNPGRTFGSLLKDGLRVRFAVFAVLIPALGYTAMY